MSIIINENVSQKMDDLSVILKNTDANYISYETSDLKINMKSKDKFEVFDNQDVDVLEPDNEIDNNANNEQPKVLNPIKSVSFI
jgi:deoxycytidine triphosphate deaminase